MEANKMDKLRIGIVGVGGIANGKHMPSLAKLKSVEMVAFCDLISERAVAGARKYGIPGAAVYTDYRELIARPDIDIVHVLTPNKLHAEISIAALEAGKHVMCEKPMAIHYAEAKAMVDAA
jgi:predicted dehydrogenase